MACGTCLNSLEGHYKPFRTIPPRLLRLCMKVVWQIVLVTPYLVPLAVCRGRQYQSTRLEFPSSCRLTVTCEHHGNDYVISSAHVRLLLDLRRSLLFIESKRGTSGQAPYRQSEDATHSLRSHLLELSKSCLPSPWMSLQTVSWMVNAIPVFWSQAQEQP